MLAAIVNTNIIHWLYKNFDVILWLSFKRISRHSTHVAVPVGKTFCLLLFWADLHNPSGVIAVDSDHLCAELGSQSGCDDALLWRLKRNSGLFRPHIEIYLFPLFIVATSKLFFLHQVHQLWIFFCLFILSQLNDLKPKPLYTPTVYNILFHWRLGSL